jgi:hypothetical protein
VINCISCSHMLDHCDVGLSCDVQVKASISEPALRFSLYEPVEFIRSGPGTTIAHLQLCFNWKL